MQDDSSLIDCVDVQKGPFLCFTVPDCADRSAPLLEVSISLLECVHADLVWDTQTDLFCFSGSIFITAQLI